MEIKGVLKQVHPTETRNDFSSRKVWLTIDPQGQYPQTIEVEAQQKNLNLFNNITPGTWVTCSINLRGREWTNKEGKTVVFNTISVWKVEVAGKIQGQQPAQAPAATTQQTTAQQAPVTDIPEIADDSPF